MENRHDEGHEQEEEAKFALDDTFGREFEDVAKGIQLMDRIQVMVSAIVRAKKTPRPTQSKQLADMTQDVKVHLTRLQAKYLKLQGKYIEQSQTINKLINKGPKDVSRIQDTIENEMAKLDQPKPSIQLPSHSCTSIADVGAQPQIAPTAEFLQYTRGFQDYP